MYHSRVWTCFRRYSSLPRMPECDFVPKKYSGPSFEKLIDLRKTYLNPALKTHFSKPLALAQGHKQWLWDIEGKRYLDMFGGICTVSVGHCHPKITAAITEQMETLGHISTIYYNEKVHEYGKRLAEKMPGKLKVLYFVNSGSEANDLAILLARAYTNRYDILSFQSCYHGMTYQAMCLTGTGSYKYPVPQNGGFFKTMNPDVYQGIWGGKNCRDSVVQTTRSCSCLDGKCNAEDQYVRQLEHVLETEVAKNNIAAFFAESIQGYGGAIQYPRNYLKRVSDLVHKHGGLFVSDEVQTGFGRTGDHFWGFEGHDIQPDIVTMAKGIGNGFPMGAVATTPEIAQALDKASHFNTFGGNPLASTAGITVLDIIEEEGLQRNSKEIGTYILLELEKLRNKFEVIGDVRGKGLIIGIEMVNDKESKRPLDSTKLMKIWENCRENGVIFGKGGLYGNVFRIKPPMCITKEDAEFAIRILENALASTTSS